MATTIAHTASQSAPTTFQLLKERHASMTQWERVVDFLEKTPCLPYGYRYNTAEKAGIHLMVGGSTAVEWLKKTQSDIKHVPLVLYKITAIALLILSIPFTLLGAAIKYIGSLTPHAYQELLDTSVEKTNPETIDQIYEVFRIFNEAAVEEGLTEWFLYSGSALGEQVRNGIILWDDDGDIGLLNTPQNMEKLERMKKKLAERGVVFDTSLTVKALDHFSDQKFYTMHLDPKKVEQILGYKPKHRAMIDIFLLDKVEKEIKGKKTQVYFHNHETCRRKFWYEYVLPEELENPDGTYKIEKRPFGPPRPDGKGRLMLNCLTNPTSYLKRTYGNSCLEYGRTSHSHLFFCGLSLPPISAIPTECKNTPGVYAEGKRWRWPVQPLTTLINEEYILPPVRFAH